MTALLTDNLPLLTGASNGIKKLRQLILELAVRGKLVPQDPNDEPASEILKRITEQKARLVNERKKLKLQAEISEQEKPFSVPKSWGWVRLGSCLEMVNGRAFKPTEWRAAGLPIVRIQNLNKPDAPFNYCSPETVDNRHIIDNGAILISWSGTPGTSFGAFIWERGKAALNQHIFSCSQIGDAFFDKFLKLAINTRLEELIAKAHGGVGLQHVTKGKLEALTLVLPPLAEQHRIVAKVDELMALCDRLEAQQADAESAHAQLVQAILDSLTQANDATDFAANWQRLAEHFHTLFTDEPSIDALKRALLQLAVMGKLVRQDHIEVLPNLLSFGTKAPKLVDEEFAPYPVPSQWNWICLCDLLEEGRDISYGVIKLGTEPKQGGVPTLRCSDVKPGYIDLRGVRRVAHDIEQDYVRTRLRGGEILINIRGTLGGVAVADKKLAGYNVAREVAVVPINPNLNAQYLSIAMQSSYFWQKINQQLRGIAYKGLNLGALRLFPIPTPPVAEQNRIVAKVNQLMALCDQLKTCLTQARQLNEQLTSTLVEQAVA